MLDALPHPADFQLAQSCLEGDSTALTRFQETFRPTVTAYLIGAGASADEAREVTESLWADCVATEGIRPAKLSRYNGTCALQTWLKTVALNNLLTRKRREERWKRLIPCSVSVADADESDPRENAWPADESAASPPETLLLEIMRTAIEAAFASCPAEDFVLLQLAHAGDLRGFELALMFGCGEATICRHLQSAARQIADATLQQIHQTDPWLELKWEDFLELCRVASPACFGAD